MCSEPALKRWFVEQESRLLGWRVRFGGLEAPVAGSGTAGRSLLQFFAQQRGWARSGAGGLRGGGGHRSAAAAPLPSPQAAAAAASSSSSAAAAPAAAFVLPHAPAWRAAGGDSDLLPAARHRSHGSEGGAGAAAAAAAEERTWEVPWGDALAIVRCRGAELRGGMLRLRLPQLLPALLQQLRAHLDTELLVQRRALPLLLAADGRLAKMLGAVRRKIPGSSLFGTGERGARGGPGGGFAAGGRAAPGSLLPDDVDGVAARSFPLCARRLHTHLRRQHHLRYYGRLQHWLFLKGAGLSLEHALAFWRGAFTASGGGRMSDRDFDKEFVYDIKHSYGKVGKCYDYPPYTCRRLLDDMSAPQHGECHGCAFKTLDAARLRDALLASAAEAAAAAGADGDAWLEQQLDRDAARAQVEGLVQLAAQGQFQDACAGHFRMLHPGREPARAAAFASPSEWFAGSSAFYQGSAAALRGAKTRSGDGADDDDY